MIVRAGGLLDLTHLHGFRLVFFLDQGAHRNSFLTTNSSISPLLILSPDRGQK
jgi:hypothetical protein